MKENRNFLLELYREFGDNAQKALDFIKVNESMSVEPIKGEVLSIAENDCKDGIYLVYQDGSYSPFDVNCAKEDVKNIGIIHDGHSFCIALKDSGRYQLVRDDDECPDESELYLPRECDALNDWDFQGKTKHIQEVGTDISLGDGEYIPTLPMLVAMCHLVEKINEALIYVGGEPLDTNSNYWSATECSSTVAWNVNFGNGGIWYYGKYNSYAVRPVAAFNL